MTVKYPAYSLAFSVDDDGWIATSDQHPYCSWIEDDPIEALIGLRRLEREIDNGTYPAPF